MALKDHTLDDRITAAAQEEFLTRGYSGASLRKIAEKAGVTVGAIQTRYKSKDALFASLVQPLLDDVEAVFQSVRADYYSGAEVPLLPQLEVSMRRESAAILRLIFGHYTQAVLLFCRSSGSSLEGYFDSVVRRKIEESIRFFHHADCQIDETVMRLLLSAQLDSYRRIVSECADGETAERCMNALMDYHLGGWTAYFRSMEQAQEGTAHEV